MRPICEVRTTVNLDPDTAATVDAPRRDKGLGLSEVVNETHSGRSRGHGGRAPTLRAENL